MLARGFADMIVMGGEGAHLAGTLTLLPSHACCHIVSTLQYRFSRQIRLTSPSKIPSPVVAQLGSTFQI
jgi:hypothetical protein